jgi:hypothetical protein
MAFGKHKRLSDIVTVREDRRSDGALRAWLFTEGPKPVERSILIAPYELAKLPQVAALLAVAREVVRIDDVMKQAATGDLEPVATKARAMLEVFDAR